LSSGQALSELDDLRAFCASESTSPKYLVLPKHLGVAWAKYLPFLHLVEVLPAGRLFTNLAALPAKQLFEVFAVEQRPLPGVIATAELPDPLRSLPHVGHSHTHTFVFTGQLAGIETSILFHGGATTSFVDANLVARYNLLVHHDPREIRLANGSSVLSPGTVHLHLRIQKYCSTVTLRVLPLVPGFGVVLGDDWARRHQLLVDYGVPTLHQAPSLLLRSKHLRLFPKTSAPVASGSSTLECHVISAQQSKRLLG
jgi:hypothetical protein